jgi:hypothetical protein
MCARKGFVGQVDSGMSGSSAPAISASCGRRLFRGFSGGTRIWIGWFRVRRPGLARERSASFTASEVGNNSATFGEKHDDVGSLGISRGIFASYAAGEAVLRQHVGFIGFASRLLHTASFRAGSTHAR